MTINSSSLNSSSLNISSVPSSILTGEYSFASFSLHDLINITMRRVDNDDLTKIDLSTYELAYNHGGAVQSRYYRGTQVHLIGSVKAPTAELFHKYLDTLKKALSKVEGTLKIRNRKIKATLTKMAYDRDHYNINWSRLDLVFTTVDPFWTEGATSNGYIGLTGTVSEEVTYLGTAPSNPIWYMVFGAGSSVSQFAITHSGLNLTVNNTFIPGDVLLIDGDNKEVKKNGVDIDFTGVFPEFLNTSNPFTLGFTGSVLTDVTLIFDTNYL